MVFFFFFEFSLGMAGRWFSETVEEPVVEAVDGFPLDWNLKSI